MHFCTKWNSRWMLWFICADVVHDLSVCTTCCAVLNGTWHSLQISDLRLTLTLTLAKLCSAFCKLRRLTDCTLHRHCYKVISVKSSRWLASVKMYMRRPVEFISPTLLLLVCICVSVCVSVCGWNANGDCCGRQSAVHAPDECFIGDTPWRNWSWRITVNTGWHCVFVAVTRPIYPHQFLSSRVSPWLCAPELVVIFVSKTFDILEKLMYIYSVSQKNTPDIFSCNLNKYFPISITFGTSIT